MDGRVVDPLEGLSIHPELDHLWRIDDTQLSKYSGGCTS